MFENFPKPEQRKNRLKSALLYITGLLLGYYFVFFSNNYTFALAESKSSNQTQNKKSAPKAIQISVRIKRLFSKAEKLNKAAQRQDALKIYKEILQIDPENLSAHERIAESYIKLKNFISARKYLRLSLALNSKDTRIHYWLAAIERDKKLYQRALESLSEDANIPYDSLRADILYNLGSLNWRDYSSEYRKLYPEKKDLQSSQEDNKNEQSGENIFQESRTRLGKENPDLKKLANDAIAYLEEASSLQPPHTDSLLLLTEILQKLSRFGDASYYYNKYLVEKGKKEAISNSERNRLAILYAAAALPKMASNEYLKILKTDPNELSALDYLYKQAQTDHNTVKALEYWNRLYDKRKTDKLFLESGHRLYRNQNAELKQETSNLPRLVDIEKQLIELDPQNTSLRYTYASNLRKLSRTDKYKRALEAILKIDSQHYPSLRDLALLERSYNNIEKSLSYFIRALRENDTDKLLIKNYRQTVLSHAANLLKESKRRQAIFHYKAYLDMQPEDQAVQTIYRKLRYEAIKLSIQKKSWGKCLASFVDFSGEFSLIQNESSQFFNCQENYFKDKLKTAQRDRDWNKANKQLSYLNLAYAEKELHLRKSNVLEKLLPIILKEISTKEFIKTGEKGLQAIEFDPEILEKRWQVVSQIIKDLNDQIPLPFFEKITEYELSRADLLQKQKEHWQAAAVYENLLNKLNPDNIDPGKVKKDSELRVPDKAEKLISKRTDSMISNSAFHYPDSQIPSLRQKYMAGIYSDILHLYFHEIRQREILLSHLHNFLKWQESAAHRHPDYKKYSSIYRTLKKNNK